MSDAGRWNRGRRWGSTMSGRTRALSLDLCVDLVDRREVQSSHVERECGEEGGDEGEEELLLRDLHAPQALREVSRSPAAEAQAASLRLRKAGTPHPPSSSRGFRCRPRHS